ncbi:putative magnesium or manganese-dependent protein phosphatase [Streptantibioticus cattleyicolor NRRL 8057 = DSM 46488]|nr:putative magnesium or manganese-dependent protein phosphatase [Streptantibioticus cattleyicolor NRRL 8057 = DSM 46488]
MPDPHIRDPAPGLAGTLFGAPAPAAAPLDALADALRDGTGELSAHVSALYVLPAGGTVLELLMINGLPPEFVSGWEHISLPTPLPVADAAREGRLIWVGDEQEMARRYPRVAVALPYDFRLAATPLTADGVTHGSMFVAWPARHPRLLAERERERLEALAGELAGLLARTRPPVRAGEPLVVLPETGPPGSEVALLELLERLPDGKCALDLRGRVVYATPCAAKLLDVPAEQLLGRRPWRVLPWLRDPAYEDRYRAALVSREPTSFVAFRPPDQWLAFQLYPGPTGLTVRITAAEAAQGDLPGPAPAPPPAEPAAGMPTRAGALYHILHLATALTEAVGVQDVVRLVADQIAPAFGGQAVALLVAEGGRLRNIGHRGYPPGVVERIDGTPLTRQTPGVQALTSGVPAFFESREELERVYPVRPEVQDTMAAWAYLPLVASGRLVGTCVLAFARPHRFTVDERAVLTSVGGLIAQALDRARVYDAKLELAHGLQESLLPHALPLLPGLETAARYLPGTEGMDIGGDFYDVIRVDRHHAGAVIGDVQGHNVRAAALMGQIRTSVHAFAKAGAPPDMVLARTNQLMAYLDTGLLASCAYLRLDLNRRRAALAVAGHPRPLVRDPRGQVRLLDAPGGLLLGVVADTGYPVTRLPLPAGTTVALYTDGLVEGPGVDLDESVAALADQLARHGAGPLETVADALVAHAERAKHRTDDTALLLLRSVPR